MGQAGTLRPQRLALFWCPEIPRHAQILAPAADPVRADDAARPHRGDAAVQAAPQVLPALVLRDGERPEEGKYGVECAHERGVGRL